MSKLRLTKTQRVQIETCDALCDEYGLPRGAFEMGGKHGSYTTQAPNGEPVVITISCTPRDTDDCKLNAAKNFRHNIARVMGWTT